jgi:hypothetical protein
MKAEGQPAEATEVAIAASAPSTPDVETTTRAMPWPVPMPMSVATPEVAASEPAEPVAVATVEPALVVEAAPSEPTSVAVEVAPVAAPVVAPVVASPEPEVAVAAQAPQAPQPPAVDLSATLEHVGLVMIETAATRTQSAAPIEIAKPQLGRKPKAPVVIPDEPLQMVETRHD